MHLYKSVCITKTTIIFYKIEMANQGRSYLRNVEGTIPGDIDFKAIADRVYEELRTHEAVHDLSLVDPSDWIAPHPCIDMSFTRCGSYCALPDSKTHMSATDDSIATCYVFYHENDLNCPPIMQGRIAHELTHGIRVSIAVDYNHTLPAGHPHRLSKSTPSKAPKIRHRPFTGKFGMEKAYFHAGYWMEHRLFGGVVVLLFGEYILNDVKHIIPPESGMFFKVDHKGGSRHFPLFPDNSYDSIYGYVFLPGANPPFENQIVTIYHADSRRICRIEF